MRWSRGQSNERLRGAFPLWPSGCLAVPRRALPSCSATSDGRHRFPRSSGTALRPQLPGTPNNSPVSSRRKMEYLLTPWRFRASSSSGQMGLCGARTPPPCPLGLNHELLCGPWGWVQAMIGSIPRVVLRPPTLAVRSARPRSRSSVRTDECGHAFGPQVLHDERQRFSPLHSPESSAPCGIR